MCYYGVSHHLPFCPNSFTCQYSLQWVIDMGPLTSSTSPVLDFTKTPLIYPCVPQSRGDAGAMSQQGRPFPVLQQLIDRLDGREHHLKELDVGLGGSWAGQSGPPPLPPPVRSSTVPPMSVPLGPGLLQLSRVLRSQHGFRWITDYRYLNGLQWQDVPRTSTQNLTATGRSRKHHGLGWQGRPVTLGCSSPPTHL